MSDATKDLPLLEAALDAAHRGWHVFPLRPGTKIPAITQWQTRATTDENIIRRWWTPSSRNNIGIACGPSGLLVVDLDAAHGPIPTRWAALGATHGRDVLALLAGRAQQPDPTATFTVATPSGGEHRYFRLLPGSTLRSTTGEHGNGLGWHIDTRGPGSLIAAPGSRTTSDGRSACWRTLHDRLVAVLPAWLVTALSPPPTPATNTPGTASPPVTGTGRRIVAYVHAALEREYRNVAIAEPGTRHITVFAAAAALGELAANDWITPTTITTHLTRAARRHVGVAGFTTTELARTIRDGIHTGRRHPRALADRPHPRHNTQR